VGYLGNTQKLSSTFKGVHTCCYLIFSSDCKELEGLSHMKFLADENISAALVNDLKRLGYDILRVDEIRKDMGKMKLY